MKSMFKKEMKNDLNLKIFRFLLIAPILFSLPIPNFFTDGAKAGMEFQWDQNDGFRRLKWFQKNNKKQFRNKLYFFLRPNDRNNSLLKIDFVIPKTFKTIIKNKNISLCKVKIGGFDSRTKCLEDIPVDIKIKEEESSMKIISIFPLSPIPSSKDSYAIVLKASNPTKGGLFQFHSYGQPSGKTSTSYLGSWTIMID